MAATKKVFIKTFGCQMNVYDSERIGEALGRVGYLATGRIEEADMVVLNTCHIREKAAEKVYSELGRIRQLKAERGAQGKDTLITVAGCVAQAEGNEIVRRAPVVDLVVGPQSYDRLGDLIERRRQERRPLVETQFPLESKFQRLPERSRQRRPSAFLTVQEGCDKFCTFCVVPYTRGAEYSRPVAEIEAEARHLLEAGARELTLLGQNVNAYRGLGPTGARFSLADLIRHLARLEKLERLRYTTSHPGDMSDDLIGAHADVAKLMPHLHLPFQSGSDRILAAMNRKHGIADYLGLVERLRAARPDIALSSDIIVGFPGETEADFAATLALTERVGFAQAYAFKYSPRPGTPASRLGEVVPEAEKMRRLTRLQALLGRQQTSFNLASVGRTMPVLFEREGQRGGQVVGRSPYLQAVYAPGAVRHLGALLDVEIVAAGPNSLSGLILEPRRGGHDAETRPVC
ncbi:MAG TPA: tRNA (N6-isopentenyl adenosine(37)-C2)-methylthiotransferase MiaB [Hyphomicrobiaceae bacterium]|jgi:tRNA-2-methylthio-N6-dimethylallyladenosine synthase|nr:tRNA (N6-isopentenyl adenosine(37)-C2)-methylthiotransferase MiaB [Hyphomicrobiaceae bacterium]